MQCGVVLSIMVAGTGGGVMHTQVQCHWLHVAGTMHTPCDCPMWCVLKPRHTDAASPVGTASVQQDDTRYHTMYHVTGNRISYVCLVCLHEALKSRGVGNSRAAAASAKAAAKAVLGQSMALRHRGLGSLSCCCSHPCSCGNAACHACLTMRNLWKNRTQQAALFRTDKPQAVGQP
jgi:hypothetical protein